jgi:RNA polymerase sigma-70 factor (ECF subfamily)
MDPESRPSRRTPVTRKSLLVRLKNWHDEQSWAEFAKIYERLMFDTALRAGLNNEEAKEVVQETLLTVAKKMAGFNYDPRLGSFKNWLMQITRRRIVDQFRKRKPDLAQTMHSTAPVDVEQLSDPSLSRLETLWNEEWNNARLDLARAVVKRKVGARQYQMFDLYVLQSKSLKEVTGLLRVNPAQVYMAKYRITRMLKKELKELDRQEL